MSAGKVDKTKLIETLLNQMKENPILTVWSAFIAPIVGAILYDVYVNGITDNILELLGVIGGIYLVVMIAVSLMDYAKKRSETFLKKNLMTEQNKHDEIELGKMQEENDNIIALANERAKIHIVKNVADLDYHLRLYELYASSGDKAKLKIIEEGIEFQREQLRNIDMDYESFHRYYVFGEEPEIEEPSSENVPEPSEINEEDEKS